MVANEKSAKEAKSHDRLHRQLAALEVSLRDHRREAEDFSQGLKSMQKQHALDKHKAAMVDVFEKEREQAMSKIADLEARLTEMHARQNVVASVSRPRGTQYVLLGDHASGGTLTTSCCFRRSTGNEPLQREQTQLISDRKILTGQVRYLQSLYARENTFRDGMVLQKQYLLRLLGKFRQT